MRRIVRQVQGLRIILLDIKRAIRNASQSRGEVMGCQVLMGCQRTATVRYMALSLTPPVFFKHF